MGRTDDGVSMATARLLESTGQLWKLVLTLLLLSVSGLVVLGLGSLEAWLAPETSLRVLCLATATGMVAWGLLFFGVHCPGCRTNLFWRALRSQTTDWLPWLLSLESCPECGFAVARQVAVSEANSAVPVRGTRAVVDRRL